MTQLLELSDSEFKITMNNISKALVEKVDNMYEQRVNFGRGMETI